MTDRPTTHAKGALPVSDSSEASSCTTPLQIVLVLLTEADKSSVVRLEECVQSLQQRNLAADPDVGHLMAGLSQDFDNLKLEFDRLLESLSASVHDATKLTLEHTTLYDSAVGELQVINCFTAPYIHTDRYTSSTKRAHQMRSWCSPPEGACTARRIRQRRLWRRRSSWRSAA